MNKVVITFGLIAGLIVSVMLILTAAVWQDAMDYNLGMIIGYLTMIVAFSMVFVGIKSFRDQHNDGIISFDRAFQLGILIALIASLMYASTWEVYYRVSAGDFMEKYTEHYISEMESQGAAPTEIDQMKQDLNETAALYKNPVIRFGMTLMEIVPVGLIITLISSLILKRRQGQGV